MHSQQEASYTRNYYARAGYDSIHWAQVEALRNRSFNPENGVSYPLVSEDLWMKHAGGKRGIACAADCRPTKRWIKQVLKYGGVLDDDDVANRALKAARELSKSTRLIILDDERFSIPVLLHRTNATLMKKRKGPIEGNSALEDVNADKAVTLNDDA